ncbi:uncharacterized protein RJT20DRAFT_125745 [Scheffersomyces xylosifermentans]|uniref:uncharacterized protein n=1 Tax=Scheffersomyces xylosifermentans TaxID=1304137 RepID=UPI00315CDE05
MLRIASRRVSVPVTRRIASRIVVSPLVVSSKCFYSTQGSVKAFVPEVKPLGQDKTVENNIKSDANRLAKTLTKFWEKVDTNYNEVTGQYEVQLDGKTLKTPLGFPLALPASKKQLAYLIAHEWSNLPDLKIKTNALPLTSVAARSIDLIKIHTSEDSNKSEMIAKVGDLDDIKINMLRYLDTDTCLIFTTTDEYSGKLRKKQDELYLPLIAEFEDFFTTYAKKQGNLLPSEDAKVELEYLDCETDGLRGNKQSITTQNIVLHWLNNLPIYDLIALEKAILTSKSFLCGVTLLRSNVSDPKTMKELYQLNRENADDYYHKTIEEIVEMGNLETIFQTEEWGEVEDTHDVDKVDWLRNLTSAALLCH